MIIRRELSFSTKGNTDIIDLTSLIEDVLKDAPISNGLACVFAHGATCAITTIEYEPGLVTDLRQLLEKLIPKNESYHHNQTWGDGNGHSHLRAALIGPSITVPVVERRMQLGTWQQIVYIDFDVHSRDRTVTLQIMGD